jgi:hypothetical protein
MPKQAIRCHLDIADLDDHLRADPMDPREHERRAEPTAACPGSGHCSGGGTSYAIASSLLKQWQADGIHGL